MWCSYFVYEIELISLLRFIWKVYAEGVDWVLWPLETKRLFLQFLHDPSHIASIFRVLISKPLASLKTLKSFSSWETESRSRIISSAYCVVFNLFLWLTWYTACLCCRKSCTCGNPWVLDYCIISLNSYRNYYTL